jgi:hypothetical protein
MSRRPRRNHTPAFKVSFGVQNCPPYKGRKERSATDRQARPGTRPLQTAAAVPAASLPVEIDGGRHCPVVHNPAMMMFGPNQHRPTNEFASSTN